MTWRPWLVVALVAALVFWRLDHVTAQRDDLQAAVEQSAETITAMAQQAQRDSQTDAMARTYQAALQASHEENQLRRDAIGTGARVVYVKARCPTGGVHQAPGATGSADAGRAVLAAADGQVVSDLRAGVER
ncbi:lysis system i-spanin subunit Rz, partial [Pseudomonas aeruginosa]|uniref:lysis system i-spanin subunit Rz n=1 Tax=Pseudomonas aeruginosa TaxID=287 RepID=UPI0015E6336A